MASQNSNRRRICAMFNALDSKVSSSGWVIMLWSWERLYVKRSINTASCWRLETRISSHGTVFFATKQKSSLFWLLYRSFVAVSEVYLKNYFDKALSGALADQVRYLFYGCYQLKIRYYTYDHNKSISNQRSSKLMCFCSTNQHLILLM